VGLILMLSGKQTTYAVCNASTDQRSAKPRMSFALGIHSKLSFLPTHRQMHEKPLSQAIQPVGVVVWPAHGAWRDWQRGFMVARRRVEVG